MRVKTKDHDGQFRRVLNETRLAPATATNTAKKIGHAGSSRMIMRVTTAQNRRDRQIEENAFAALKELTGAHAWNVVNSRYDTRARSIMLHRLKTDLRVVSSNFFMHR